MASAHLTQARGLTEEDLDALIAKAGQPILLDLFGCQGGAAAGYREAGFYVICLDLRAQPRNPFPSIQADAIWFLARFAEWIKANVKAVHASPPCQAFTKAQKIRGRQHPDLVEPVRELLEDMGLPYVIENVEGSPLRQDILLCGAMFGIRTYRHRVFELGKWGSPPECPDHPAHTVRQTKMGRPVRDGEFMQIVGNFSNAELARQIMGMPWASREGLREAIPPVYSEFIGRQLIRRI